MLTLKDETHIGRPPEVVLPIAADPENRLKWDSGGMVSVAKLSDGPLGPGAHCRGRWKRLGEIDDVCAEYDPPRGFAHDARMGMGRVRHVQTCQDDGAGGTRYVQEGTLEPTVLVRVLWPVVRIMLRRRLRQIGQELKEYGETLPVTTEHGARRTARAPLRNTGMVAPAPARERWRRPAGRDHDDRALR